MAKLLQNKVALITGAGHHRGIGRAIFNALAAEGATVVGCDLKDATGLNEIEGLACDVTNKVMVQAMVDTIIAKYGQLDIVVNNAGVGRGSADFMAITDEDWDISLAVNLRGMVNVCKAVIPHMQARGGSIINVASLAGTGALPTIPACYTASKFAAVGLTKQLALQYAANNIRVNAVCPGSVITQMHETTMTLLAEAEGISLAEAQTLEEQNIPLGRSAQPAEIGQAAVYLASDLSQYVTGTTLPVAGGMAPGL